MMKKIERYRRRLLNRIVRIRGVRNKRFYVSAITQQIDSQRISALLVERCHVEWGPSRHVLIDGDDYYSRSGLRIASQTLVVCRRLTS